MLKSVLHLLLFLFAPISAQLNQFERFHPNGNNISPGVNRSPVNIPPVNSPFQNGRDSQLQRQLKWPPSDSTRGQPQFGYGYATGPDFQLQRQGTLWPPVGRAYEQTQFPYPFQSTYGQIPYYYSRYGIYDPPQPPYTTCRCKK